jgi:hypothetical protein
VTYQERIHVYDGRVLHSQQIILAESPLTLLAVLRGHARVIPDAGASVRLSVGDVSVTRGPDQCRVGDDPGTPTTVAIDPGQHCCSPEGNSLWARMTLGVRTRGNHPQGETLMLVGPTSRRTISASVCAERWRHYCR